MLLLYIFMILSCSFIVVVCAPSCTMSCSRCRASFILYVAFNFCHFYLRSFERLLFSSFLPALSLECVTSVVPFLVCSVCQSGNPNSHRHTTMPGCCIKSSSSQRFHRLYCCCCLYSFCVRVAAQIVKCWQTLHFEHTLGIISVKICCL